MIKSTAGKPEWDFNRCAVIVAHPDDEALWAGGTILAHPESDWMIVSLCRGGDPDRRPRFFQVLKALKASGKMADLDDGPRQIPLPEEEVDRTILSLLPQKRFDLILTHSFEGEYIRHRRHEETGRAVVRLWEKGPLQMRELWMFAYEDDSHTQLPHSIVNAHHFYELPPSLWKQKHDLIVRTYGFTEDSWEARTTPKTEAFWRFSDPARVRRHFAERNKSHESPGSV
ncbi:MAG: PIG-L family deacetylase [Sedimentisphaerales bacterium]|nr:PIG-L family deacetylase [Sedimentisphaerales bacterium]